MNNLTDFIMVENIFSPEFCSNAIDLLNQDESWHKHRWYNKREDNFNVTKDGMFNVTYNQSVNQMMYPHIVQVLNNYTEYVHDFLPLNKLIAEDSNATHVGIVKQMCRVRFNRYDVGDKIKTHIDHIHSLFDGNHKGIPAVSLVGVLNDDYEGGEFFFWDDYVVELKAGDVVLFPSIFLYQHGVKPITKGSRYSWVVWSY